MFYSERQPAVVADDATAAEPAVVPESAVAPEATQSLKLVGKTKNKGHKGGSSKAKTAPPVVDIATSSQTK